MPQIESIREMYAEGKSIRSISRTAGIDFATAKKYIEQHDFSERLPSEGKGKSVLDPYMHEINSMLEENRRNWYKQRYTAKRIYDLLKEKYEKFPASYSTVCHYAAGWKKNNQRGTKDAFSHLVWHKGEAQADFGEADFIRDGKIIRYKYFVLSFPYSNKAYCQIYQGENCECVCQALINIFEHIGGVPALVVFDNATGIGHRICRQLEENEMFRRFRLQYRFESRFCNPNAGHEKGNVETNVGYVRRNLFVPLIKIPEDVESYNRDGLFDLCGKLMSRRIHYIHKVPVNELFKDDRKALLALPEKRFMARRIITVKTNGYAEFVLGGLHHYTLGGAYMNTAVIAETWPWKVRVYDSSGKFIEEFEREYICERTESMSMKTCISAVVSKPGSWPNSMFRENIGEDNPFRQYADTVNDACTRKGIFTQFRNAMHDFDYETVLAAFTEMAERKADMRKEANVLTCCSRVSAGTLNMSSSTTGVDLNKYAALMAKEAVHEQR